MNPLKQGLKHTEYDLYKIDHMMVKEVNPLKQGLKPVDATLATTPLG